MNILWLMRRLRAMSVPEILWRVGQKWLEKREYYRFGRKKCAVTEIPLPRRLSELSLCAQKAVLCRETLSEAGERTVADADWHAGIQTKNRWPLQFAYALDYRGRDDIGDARSNWELHRHHQLTALAAYYCATGEGKYLRELTALFDDWNRHNPYLWGIAWTSPMELAVRSINWCYTYGLLTMSENVPEVLLAQLRRGILTMTDYLAHHYSRYSSANNHLIVEAAAIAHVGILCDYAPWRELGVKLLTEEFPRQNERDGINREQSLHYQSFYMEAVGLTMRLMEKNAIPVPPMWQEYLTHMARYLRDCRGKYGETVEFGDNDLGHLLPLGGERHEDFALGLMSYLLEERYCDLTDCGRALRWLYGRQERQQMQEKPLYTPPQYICRREGGITLWRSTDERVLMGIDHAPLGFGSIAAHGHADALSFQLFVEGKPLFLDPGTSLYHCDRPHRDACRSTAWHNTITVNGQNQSEMLGPFLWGRRANCSLLSYGENGSGVTLTAEHDGYAPTIHRRTLCFDGHRCLRITDTVTGQESAVGTLVLRPDVVPELSAGGILHLPGVTVTAEPAIEWQTEKITTYPHYGAGTETIAMRYGVPAQGGVTLTIQIEG